MGFHFQTEEEETYQIQLSAETIIIQDGHRVFYYIEEVPENVFKICSHVFDMMPKTGTIIFSTESLECKQRGCGKKLIIKGERYLKSLQIRNKC